MSRRRAFRYCALGVAVLGAALAFFGALRTPGELAFAYLAALGCVASTLVGALALLAMMQLLDARWFVVLCRICLALTTPTASLPLLFLPIALMVRWIYPWAGSLIATPESTAPTARAQLFGHPWLGAWPFLLRASLYLLVWIAIAEAFRRSARASDQRAESWFLKSRAAISALSLPALGCSGTWAAFDWLMSAVPSWNMTSVGLYFLSGGFASALGVLALLVHIARAGGRLPCEVGVAHCLALGRLLFAAVCLWAYIAVSQLIIVWSADLPREAAFYVPRARGGWRYLAALLIFGHFVVPFLLLLSRKWKESSGFLAGVGAWIAAMHAIDLYWLMVPSACVTPSILDTGPFLLLAALAVLIGALRSGNEPLVPLHDPELARSLGYQSP